MGHRRGRPVSARAGAAAMLYGGRLPGLTGRGRILNIQRLMSANTPELLDAWRMVATRSRLEGRLALSSMPRLSDALADTDVAIGTLPRLHLVIDDLPLRVIALDSVADGESRGRLDPADLDWLGARLDAAPERETAVFLHHPPFANGIPFSDREICRGADGLGALLARHPQVIGLGSGHVHRAVRTMVGGVPAWIAPSVA